MSPELRLVRRVLESVRTGRPVVTVVGDVMLDRWTIGTAERVSREAPAPVVRVTETIDVPGGAANTAMNLAALGAHVRLVAVLGDDQAGDVLLDRLRAASVDTTGMVRTAGRTTTKARIVGGDRVVVRVDEIADPPDDHASELLLRGLATSSDGVVVCDYGVGLRADDVSAAIAANRPGTVVVDAHDLGRWRGLAPDLVTPNCAEAEALLGRSSGQGAARAGAIAASAGSLREATGAHDIVVTLDRDGTVVLPGPRSAADTGAAAPVRTRAVPASEQQASGAGDTFCAAATLALVVGEDVADAARFAQAAADLVVREPGTTTCDAEALLASAEAPAAAVLDHDELVAATERARADGRRVVFTNGCFDVVHRGHTTYLKQARALGDLLVVAVNDDDSVRRLKGPERPINPVEDRAGVLAALACVDLVTVFATDTPVPLLERVRPDVYVKGGDYSPDMLAETPVVRAHGGEVVMVDYVPEHSTSEVVRRIRGSAD